MPQLTFCVVCQQQKHNHASIDHTFVEKVDPLDEMVPSPFVSQVHNFVMDGVTGYCAECQTPKEFSCHPHVFVKAADGPGCVCGKTSRALIHQMTSI